MITSDEKPRENRVVLWAILGSVLVHLLLALFYIGTGNILSKLHIVLPQQKIPKEDVVTVSSSLRLEKRAKPVPAPPPPPHPQTRAVQPRQPAPESVPVPQQVVQQPPAAVPVPSKQRHELEKEEKKAPAEPPKTVKAPERTDTPTAPPETASPVPAKAPRRIAKIAVPQTSQDAREPTTPRDPSHLSDRQIAQIQSDLSQTIARARGETNPLAVPKQEQPAATKHYAINMLGMPGDLRGYQGTCDPIKSWYADGWDYYYVICRTLLTDGTVKMEPVPWPVRFRPSADTFRGLGPNNTPLQLPLPGWKLPPDLPTDNMHEVLDYARRNGAQF